MNLYYLRLGGVGFVGVGRVVGVVTTPARNVKLFFLRTATAWALCLLYTFTERWVSRFRFGQLANKLVHFNEPDCLPKLRTQNVYNLGQHLNGHFKKRRLKLSQTRSIINRREEQPSLKILNVKIFNERAEKSRR